MAGTLHFTLGDAIANARNSTGLDQERMAQLLGVNPKTIGRWENDVTRVPFDAIVMIARITDRDVSWFAEFVPDTEPEPVQAATPARRRPAKRATSDMHNRASGWKLNRTDVRAIAHAA